eukprot:9276875-Ditylum_brightwellii.AAC.1
MAKQDTMALFGTTYVDTTPAIWSSQCLAAKYNWAFLQHVLWCQQKTDNFLQNISDRNRTTGFK